MNKTFGPLSLLIFMSAYLFAGPHHKKVLNLPDGKYARINDTLYAAIYEITNENYKAFLNAIYRDSGLSLYQKCIYDSAAWTTKFPNSYNAPMKKNYHNHRAFSIFPEVNIPWYGAMKYCEWLTAKNDILRGKEQDKLLFKLPSEKEWILIADVDSTGFPKGLYKGKDATGKYQVNIKTMQRDSVTIADDGGFYTVREDMYRPNRYGLYNVIGNVSEMTDTKDVEKGGNWWSAIEDCTVDKRDTFATPDPRVGFRVMLKVVK